VDGALRGTVISDAGGKANGYRNADGSREAYDLARGATLKQAYEALKKGDRLVICKHGGSHTHGAGVKTMTHEGGLIHLDGGEKFTGFKQENTAGKGTDINVKGDRPIGTPYVLPPPPGGKNAVTATLYSCWGSKKPAPNERSVKDSLEDVLGKGTVTAFDGVIKSKLVYAVEIENAASNEEAKQLADLAEKRLDEAATKAGFKNDANGWLTNTPFENQYKAANDVMAKDPKLKGKATVTFEYPVPDPPAIGPGAECPKFLVGGGRFTYGDPLAVLSLPKASIRRGLDLILLQPDATLLPAGPGQLASPALQIATARDGNAELRVRLRRPGRLVLPFFDAGATPRIYRLYKDGWAVAGRNQTVNRSTMRVSVKIDQLGTFAAFDVPLPPQTVTISEDDTWAHNEAAELSKICINVRTRPAQASATVSLDGPGGYHSQSPPNTPLINGARQFTSLITHAGDYTKTITVYNGKGAQTATVTTTFTVDPPPTDGPPASPPCQAPTGGG